MPSDARRSRWLGAAQRPAFGVRGALDTAEVGESGGMMVRGVGRLRFAALASLALVAALGGSLAQGATLRGVQHGDVSLAGNGSMVVTLPTPLANQTGAFLTFQSRHSSNRPTESMARGRIISPTQLQFDLVTDSGGAVSVNGAASSGSVFHNNGNNSLSFSHTVAGGSNKLVVGTSVEDCDGNNGEDVASITYGGTPLTRAVRTEVTSDGCHNQAEIWFLDNPPVGTADVVVTAQGNVREINTGAISLANAIAGPPQASATNTNVAASSITTSVTATSAALVIDTVASGNTGNFTQPGTQTERWDRDASTAAGAMSTRSVTGAGPVSMQQTQGTANRLAHVVVAIGGGEIVDIHWSVVEFSSGVRVQSGQVNQSSATTNVTLGTPVGSLSQAFVLWSKTPAAADQVWSEDDPVIGELTAPNNLRFRATDANGSHVIAWQVVEFTDGSISVQRGTTGGMASGETTTTATIPAAVDVARSFVLASFRISNSGADVGRRMIRAELTNGSTLTFTRESSGVVIPEIAWQVVQLDNAGVQRGVQGFGVGVTRQQVPIGAVTPARAFALSGVQPAGGQNMGSTPFTGDDIIGASSYTLDITSGTRLIIDRNHSSATGTVAWFVVEFGVLRAYYTMDEPAWQNAGDILDSSGNGNDGNPVPIPPDVSTSSATPALPNDSGGLGTCGYGVIPFNSSGAEIDGADTTLAPGNAGSISFWYRRNVAWSGQGDSMILDASVDLGDNNADNFFFLVLRNNGRLRFVVESDNDRDIRVDTSSFNFPADTWVHLAVTWDLVDSFKRAEVYVNGVVTTATTIQGGLSSTVGTTAPILMGDSRTTGVGGVGYSGESANGFIDEVRVYGARIGQGQVNADMAARHLCAGGLDHYAIFHDAEAITCQVETIRIEAHESHPPGAPVVFTGADTTIALGTSTGQGDWTVISGVPANLNNGAANDGAASYVFAAGDQGVVELGLKHTAVAEAPAAVDIGVDDGTFTESSAEDPPLSFREAGFNFLATPASAPGPIGPQIAGKPSNAGFGSQVLELQAVRTNDDTGACEAALAGSVDVEMRFECENPASCTASQVQIDGGVPTGISGTPPGVPTWQTVTLDFGDATDSTATFALTYPDAGAIELHARHNIPLDDGSGTPSGNFMVGASNEFVVRPFGFHIGGVATAADENGSVFAKAGESFPAIVSAVQWAPGEDLSPLDGAPDAGADLSDNLLTPNFGQETPPAAVDITHTLFQPSNGTPGSLAGGANLTGFSGGSRSANLAWDEVGIIDLNALQSDYLGSGFDVTGGVDNVGRFVPARLLFTVQTAPVLRDGPDAGWACAFTYMDQPFGYLTDPVIAVEAQNTAGDPTLNYGDDSAIGGEDYWKYDPPLFADRSYSDGSVVVNPDRFIDDQTGATVVLAGHDDLADGAATVTLSGDLFTYMRDLVPIDADPIAPFLADVDLLIPETDLRDSDDVCMTTVGASCNVNDGDTGESLSLADIQPAAATPNIRFGRMRIENAFGSELIALTVPLSAEYFTGSGFVVNAEDDCTSLTLAADIDLDNPATGPQAGDQPMTVGAGTTSITNGPAIAFAAGVAGLVFGPPGAGNTGFVDIDVDLVTAAQPWLRYDSDGNGVHADTPPPLLDVPEGRASFGVFAGSRQIIYEREPVPF